MRKSLEMRRHKNLDAFNEIDEMNWKSGQTNNNQSRAEALREVRELLDSYGFLIDEDDKASYEDSKSQDQEIDDMIAASNYRISELWDSSDLGKYTINTPTIDKQEEDLSAKDMEIFDENEFEKSLNAFNKTAKDGDPIKEETNAEIKRIMQQMELEW